MANEPLGVPLDDEEDELDDEEEEGDDEEEGGDEGEEGSSDEGSDSERPERKKEKGEERDEEGGLKDKIKDEAQKQIKDELKNEVKDEALGDLALAARGTGAAAEGAEVIAAGAAVVDGPLILAVFLIIVAVVVSLIALAFLFCASDGCQGTKAFSAQIDPANNKTDEQNLKDIDCLNEQITPDAKGNAKMPQSCATTIKAWSERLAKNVTSIKKKLSDKTPAGKEAIKLLDELLAATEEAKTVTTGIDVKQAREIRDKIVEANTKANQNELIKKFQGFSPNAQKIIDYVRNKPTGFCRQTTSSNCGDTADGLVTTNFPGAHHSDYMALGGLIDGPPTDKNIQDVQDQLAQGNIPIWQVRGNGRGKHFITILGINTNKDITYFDPANGAIETRPYNVDSTAGWGPYFGTPTTDRIGGNMRTRGYYWVTGN